VRLAVKRIHCRRSLNYRLEVILAGRLGHPAHALRRMLAFNDSRPYKCTCDVWSASQ